MSISSANETDIPSTCALEPPSEQTDQNDSAHACTWHFRVNIQITDQSAFDPMDFSHVLHQRNTKLHETMRNVSIISYSFLGIHQSSNSAAYDGFVHAGKQCATRLGTLKRWMTHSAIVGAVRWTQILKHRVYTKHPLIKKFLEQTSLAPSGDGSATQKRLRIDYFVAGNSGNSDAPVKKGGRPRKLADSTATAAPGTVGGWLSANG
jgi:hypothetical protein